jgi:hypothetical protein
MDDLTVFCAFGISDCKKKFVNMLVKFTRRLPHFGPYHKFDFKNIGYCLSEEEGDL